MAITVRHSRSFDRHIRKLKRKYPSVIGEVNDLISRLKSGERLPGDKIRGLGFDVYKVRLRNRDAKSGKRGGFRVIYFVELPSQVALLAIYSKTSQSDISASNIREIISKL